MKVKEEYNVPPFLFVLKSNASNFKEVIKKATFPSRFNSLEYFYLIQSSHILLLISCSMSTF